MILALVFGSFLAFLPLLIGGVSVLTTFLIVGGLTEITGVSQIVEFLIALVGLGVAIDYSLLVVSRWREERSAGRPNADAVAVAMEHAGRAVVFSGLTVAIGLLSMIVLPVPMLRSVGYGGVLVPLVSVARRDHAAAGDPGDGRARGWTGPGCAPSGARRGSSPPGPRSCTGTAGLSAAAGLAIMGAADRARAVAAPGPARVGGGGDSRARRTTRW